MSTRVPQLLVVVAVAFAFSINVASAKINQAQQGDSAN